MFWLKKVGPLIGSLGLLSYVICYTPPPQNWISATPIQIASFFIPFLLSLIFLANLFLNSFMRSIVFGFGGMFLIVLQATSNLNLLTALLTILVTIFLIRIFPKPRLTRGEEFPKLTRIFKKD